MEEFLAFTESIYWWWYAVLMLYWNCRLPFCREWRLWL